jgi:hypothetical protein
MINIEHHASFTLFSFKEIKEDKEEKYSDILSNVLQHYDVEGAEKPWPFKNDESIVPGLKVERLVVEAVWKFERLDKKGRPAGFKTGLAALLAFHDMKVYDSMIRDMFHLCAKGVLQERLDIVTYVLNFLNIDDSWIEHFSGQKNANIIDWLRFKNNKVALSRHWDAVKTAIFFDTTMRTLYTLPQKRSSETTKLHDIKMTLGKITCCGVYGPEDILVLANKTVQPRHINDPLVASCYKLEKI